MDFPKPGIKNLNAVIFFLFVTFVAIRIIRKTWGSSMNSYLVRIYRRGENNPRVLVGLVEEPGVNGKKAFSNVYELWEILNPVKQEKSLKKKNNVKKISGTKN